MSRLSWLKLLLYGKGNALLLYIIPKLFVFFNWLKLLRSM